MPLNPTTGNMYTWLTHTWNTVKGECPHGCTYCYMKRWGSQKPVRFDEKELNTYLGEDNFIFVGSSCDLFAPEIPSDWINKTLAHCDHFIHNEYLLQSKNPARIYYNLDKLPRRSHICTTIETNRYYPDIMKQCPKPVERAGFMQKITRFSKYITIEPILDFDLHDLIELIRSCGPEQVNIGADSGNNFLPEPSKEKLLQLIEALKEFTVIDQKRNLARILK